MAKNKILKNGVWALLAALGLAAGYFLAFYLVPGNKEIPDAEKAGTGKGVLPDRFKYEIGQFKSYDKKQVIYREDGSFKTGLKEPYGLAIDKKTDLLSVLSTEAVLVCNDKGVGKMSGLSGKLKMIGPAYIIEGVLSLQEEDKKDFVSGKAFSFEENGGGDGEFKFVTSVKTDGKYVFIADAGNRKVYKFDTKGKYLGQIGKKDKAAGRGFIIPSPCMDMDFDREGNLWVANTGLLKLEKYSKDGAFLGSWGEHGVNINEFIGCCNPVSFIIDREDNFITAEKGVVRIKKYDKTGKFLGIVAPPGVFNEKCKSVPLAVDSKNRIYALDTVEKTVRVFTKK